MQIFSSRKFHPLDPTVWSHEKRQNPWMTEVKQLGGAVAEWSKALLQSEGKINKNQKILGSSPGLCTLLQKKVGQHGARAIVRKEVVGVRRRSNGVYTSSNYKTRLI